MSYTPDHMRQYAQDLDRRADTARRFGNETTADKLAWRAQRLRDDADLEEMFGPEPRVAPTGHVIVGRSPHYPTQED